MYAFVKVCVFLRERSAERRWSKNKETISGNITEFITGNVFIEKERITDVYKQHMNPSSFCWLLMNENKQLISNKQTLNVNMNNTVCSVIIEDRLNTSTSKKVITFDKEYESRKYLNYTMF